MPAKPIRVGVVGLGRGMTFAEHARRRAGLELVALCDIESERLTSVAGRLGVAAYTDYDAFLAHDTDAVVLANYFHEHAPLAVRALQAGKHVMSETTACLTLAEGVELVRAVERSGLTYMLAENYPYMACNQEMRRLYLDGRIGEFQYGEGEYVHPMSAAEANALAPGLDHWRNWLPATYYCTHSLAPLMYITETMPTRVSGFVVPSDRSDPQHTLTARRNDTAGIIVARMGERALAKLLQVGLRGHGNWVRIHGNRGLVESLRGGDPASLRLRREPFDKDAGEPVETVYRPDFPHHHEEAVRAGHAGGDFFVSDEFARAIREGAPPFFDVYRAVSMAAVGILAYRSALQGSGQLPVPDFRAETERARYAADHWSPDPARRRDGDPWPSELGDIRPTAEAISYAEQVWRGSEDPSKAEVER